ncbi:hypothetical protein DC3_11490 [Deinococcus cellulosilyticus NBRC 106333 = KACC 11606]|uniref:Metallo-beta-lactamase domain-containing protein n=2 Tax=Deinococcus cellulosilyticus TaxID=401558 RepID=A0A511MY44_DEIC1|nr:hypothetical protein DC3_11490 [Deinococcus cellulosilyticus NBRC 106333 = KACC 11606]
MQIQRLHWAGVQLTARDTTLFIDTITPPEAELDPEVTTTHRHALLTHHHADHADLGYIHKWIGGTGTLVTHHDVLPFLNVGSLKVRTVGLHQPLILPHSTADFVVHAVPASDGLGDPQVSWVVEAGGKRILHAGDTLWHGHWWSIARLYGPFDVVFLPMNAPRINIGRFQDSGIPIVMTPEQAVAAARILAPELVVPIHYGRHEPGRYVETPDALNTFLKLAQEAGLKVNAMQPGEGFDLKPQAAVPI